MRKKTLTGFIDQSKNAVSCCIHVQDTSLTRGGKNEIGEGKVGDLRKEKNPKNPESKNTIKICLQSLFVLRR